MFYGIHTPKLDQKGRLFLPAKFRDQVKENLVVTRGQERALDVRTQSEFERFTERLRNAPQTDARVRAYSRMLYALASEQQPDKQGRITLTPELREYAGLSTECVVVGVSDRMEIWEPNAWAAYTEAQEQQFADIGEDFLPPL